MKNLILTITLGLILSQGFLFQAQAKTQKRVIIAVLDDGAKHEARVIKALSKLIQDCKSCEIKSYPIYKKNGDLTRDSFINALTKAEKEADLINLSWNIESTSQTKEIEQALQKTAEKKIIVAAAGAPSGAKLRQPLSGTVIGKIKGIIIVGEMTARGVLHMNAYEGPEMYTLLKPAENEVGSSFSVLKLTAEIAKRISNGEKIEEIKKGIPNPRPTSP